MTKGKLDDDIDALFTLPLAEFTGARNTLAARLKKEGRRDDAERVKLLGKPSISAWTVNQLYWNHRKAFDQLIATGKRFRPARATSNVAGMRDSLDARREALSQLSELATGVLQDAGHNPTLETMRRINTTLEALSAYALLPDGPMPGRLTQDVDPPSFESLALLLAGGGTVKEFTPKSATANTRLKAVPSAEVRRLEETRQINIAAAKVSLQDAKRSLVDARSRAQSLEGVNKHANAEAKEAERHRREAEERLKKATTAAENAARRARDVAAEVEEAANALEEAKRAVEKATRDLELLFQSRKA